VSYTVQNQTKQGTVTIYGVQINEQLNYSGSSTLEKYGMIVASNESILSLTLNGQSLSSSEWSTFVSGVEAYFLIIGLGSTYTQYGGSYLTVVNRTTISLGPTQVNATNYKSSSNFNVGCQTEFSNVQLQIGTAAGSNFGAIITYLSATITSNSTAISEVFQVTSITVNKS
jgi:hypothetical protein